MVQAPKSDADQHDQEDDARDVTEEHFAEQPQPEDADETTEEEVEDGETLEEEEREEPLEEDVVATLKTQIQEMKDQTLRAMAETENVRRRASRDVEESKKFAVTGFARDMITVGENLFLALNNIPEEAREDDPVLKALADGVDMTLRELLTVFEKHGIQRIHPQGEKFNHNFHQAISQVEDPAHEPGTVLQVVQAGYVLNERLLRPAMVVVAKRGDASQKVDTQV